MLIQSTRFGEVEVSENNIVSFPNGLPGFPDEKKFAFLLLGPDNPFSFLQSVSNPNLTFTVVEPFTFFKEYTFELSDKFVSDLQLSDKNLPRIYNIVTMKNKAENATANLLAPIIVNWQTRTAQQYILEKTDYTTRHKLFPNGLPKPQTPEGGK